MVCILLGNGFEEIEALAACDILRRAEVPACLAGISGSVIVGAHGIHVRADVPVEQIRPEDLEMVVLPGGLGGVESIEGSAAAMALIRDTAAAGKYVAAICAAPTVLAKLGVTDGKNAVVYPGMESQMGSAVIHPDCPVVFDGRLVTGRAPGAAIDFALALVQTLRGAEAAEQVAKGLVYDR